MGSQIKWVYILLLFVLLSPGYAFANITFTNGSWSSTFNYGPCSQHGGGGQATCGYPSPDGILFDYGATNVSGNYTEVVAAANNPAGGGGNGARFWIGDGDNVNSGVVLVQFSAQKEIWLRWYERYQAGFAWSGGLPGYSKEIYLGTGATGISPVIEFYGNQYAIIAQGTPNYYQVMTSPNVGGWNQVMGGSTSDGLFHCYEVHMKMDTNGSNGVGQIWIDGVLKVNVTNVNWSNNNSSAQAGWTNFQFHTNQNAPSNGQVMYVDYDDMTIYNTTPPNVDAGGNAFIGPIGGGGGGGGGSTSPTITAFAIPSISTSLTVPISSFTATNASTYCVTTSNNSSGCSWLGSAPSSVAFTAAGSQTAYGWAKNATGTLSTPATSSVTITTPVNGACGSANGQAFTSLASGSSNLCSSGAVASFTGSGPWTWGCNGSGGGTSTSSTACSASLTSSPSATLLFSENFEDENFAARGWYDNTNHGTIASGGQSGNCLQWAWTSGQTTPTNGGSIRYNNFTPTDTLYLSYYVKFQTGWEGSQQAYHPHMMYILSDLDNAANAYSPLANNYLDTYVEFLSDIGSPYTIRPQIALQDEKRTNTSNGTPPNNITAITENRSVNYCNTPVSSGATGTCYADVTYYSANTWKAASASVSTNAWHHIEAYFQMNSISGGVGQHNGIMQEWVDGTQVINQSDVLYRTNQDSTKKWAQFVLAPYIGTGSPITQTMWIDSLQVWNGNPNSGSTSMSTPSGFAVKSVSPN